jgi:hypothetical protein
MKKALVIKGQVGELQACNQNFPYWDSLTRYISP